MLRIVPTAVENGNAVLRVEGELRDAWVPLLEEQCDQSLHAHRLALDLKDVTYADLAGRSLLRRLRMKGIRLLNCPPMIEALLEDGAR